MAPAGSSVRAVPHNRQRPAALRTIVPAIPLPYIQKKKQQQAAREKAKEEVVQPPVLEPEPSQTPPQTEITPPIANGSSDEHAPDKTEQTTDLTEATEPTEALEARDAPEATSSPMPTPIPATVKEEIQEKTNESSEASVQETEVEENEIPATAPSDPPSSASRSTFHMPPAFVPASQGHPNTANESVKFPPHNIFNGQLPSHQAHGSTGSLMFGGYPESNNSSPAPPLSAGNVPPYPFQQQPQVGRHGPHPTNGNHTQHMSNGFVPMGPPAPPGYYPRHDNFMNHGASTENHPRRQMVSFGPTDGYSPSVTPSGFENYRTRTPTHAPSTPHSFHGSQSSVPNELENGPPFYGQGPTAVISNGSNGQIDEVRLYQQPRQKPRTDSQHIAPAQGNYAVVPPPTQADTYDGLLYYLQNQFADAELADYTLELRYSDDHAPPVRIPGHTLMFARSPTLKALIQAQGQENNGSFKTLLIESNDRFLRSDGFWMAVQRLYGGPLLDPGTAAIHQLPRTARQLAPVPGTPADRFDLALGYTAAGHILGIPPVINRGAELAGMLINWDTVEKALDFALDGGLDAQWSYSTKEETKSPSTYGPAVNMIIFSAMTFLITNFPPNFDLDTSVRELGQNPRLPPVREDRPAPLNPRLSLIKFGDHPSEESVRSESGGSVSVTLSKVLLNLPFHLLKYVLESPRLGNVEGWANISLRQKAMHAVIEERERRRLTALRSAYVPEKTKDRFDDTVRWQEAVSPHGPEGTPTLMRTWFDSGVAT